MLIIVPVGPGGDVEDMGKRKERGAVEPPEASRMRDPMV
jgi:hypothetical protein